MDQVSDRLDTSSIILPLPPAPVQDADMALYARFMRHLRNVPNSRVEIKILSAIQFTSDMLDYSDAHVAKVLVEQGLRAPRMAFPADFLDFMDGAQIREGWEIGAPTQAMKDLKSHWDRIGEDKFAAFRRAYSLLAEDAVI